MLTDAEFRALKPADSLYRVADAKGLTVEIPTAGALHWRLRYRFAGKAKNGHHYQAEDDPAGGEAGHIKLRPIRTERAEPVATKRAAGAASAVPPLPAGGRPRYSCVIDGRTASRAVPGSIGRAFLKSIDVVSIIGLDSAALIVAKEVFERLGPPSPTPPDGGIETNVVSFIDA